MGGGFRGVSGRGRHSPHSKGQHFPRERMYVWQVPEVGMPSAHSGPGSGPPAPRARGVSSRRGLGRKAGLTDSGWRRQAEGFWCNLEARCRAMWNFLWLERGVTDTGETTAGHCLTNATEGVRLAARIVDTPCNEMNTDTFLEEIKKVGKDLGITPTIIRDEQLKARGFGGIYGVGKAAVHPPALAVLSHTPEGATQTIAWVGKGIVYDTGGLSIKGKTTMPGMKRDCGGAAAILGAFRAAIKQGFKDNLHAVFCLAENSVGPNATRPDDIHLLYSGKTVEINNTDAEGRLVLADGVSYASKDLGADIILDMATLTGAQGIATGKYHAAVLTNSAEWEAACVKAGRRCGDLVHPLVYCPELHFSEFTSAVADMKNSVADRDNSPSSCAGLFIASHIGFDWPGVWVHVDIAAPVHAGERATGFGVALLLALFGRASEDPLLNLVSPLGCEMDAQEGDVERDSKRRRLV
ncbi:probable aminopeptidase NPEPL1 isoform X3 [Mustela putorius furo]|uniref:Probable aminopeptidase NPEPL1 isoform X3 n=1 Tax=Mustela putorius furo TaxID=9669 RepID=A0A8U0US33_MUSPF|nr:probable aminopeptidase NPEPL1 isoform X3 [Mustela putorius furo]